jgi:phosphate/sulfate permease
MSFLKFPVSANQSITGAVIGWGLCYADYSNPVILQGNLAEILEFMSTWLINPLGAAVISFVLVFVVVWEATGEPCLFLFILTVWCTARIFV